MRTTQWCAVLLAGAFALPSFAQQKTYQWVATEDETVRLDPGYYHGGRTFQPSAHAADVHVEVDAQQPVTISMALAQDWSDAAQRPEALQNLRYICVQQHVTKATYTCTPPRGTPVVMVIRDERGAEQAPFFALGEVIEKHDRGGEEAARSVSGVATALTAHPIREFISPNNVHLQYYDWSCVDNCNLPDPPQPKLFDWVRADQETVRLDAANYYTSHTYHPGPQGGNMQVDIQARFPVTLAMVDPTAWAAATEHPSAARNLNNVDYSCVQQHVVRTTYTCHLPGFWPQVLIVRDEREAGRDEHGGEHNQDQSTAGIIPVSAAGEILSESNAGRHFLYPNDVHIQYYSWNCVESCDQPDFAWVQQVKEKYELTKILKIYGGLVPDHDGAELSIRVKSPVPMAVAVLPSPIAGQLYGKPEIFESALANSSCQQRGVQSSTLQCTFKVADGPQSLVLLPEAGVNIPNHKKAEIEVQSVKCVDHCAALPAPK